MLPVVPHFAPNLRSNAGGRAVQSCLEERHDCKAASGCCRIPEECTQEVADLIQRCCSAKAEDRPGAEDIVRFMGEQLQQMDSSGTLENVFDVSPAWKYAFDDTSITPERSTASTSTQTSCFPDVSGLPQPTNVSQSTAKAAAKSLLHAFQRSWSSPQQEDVARAEQ